jgi:hypothetical protein
VCVEQYHANLQILANNVVSDDLHAILQARVTPGSDAPRLVWVLPQVEQAQRCAFASAANLTWWTHYLMWSMPRTLEDAASGPGHTASMWTKQQRQRMQLVSNLDRYLVFQRAPKGKVCFSAYQGRILNSGQDSLIAMRSLMLHVPYASNMLDHHLSMVGIGKSNGDNYSGS